LTVRVAGFVPACRIWAAAHKTLQHHSVVRSKYS
jgi:hypothetical protein